jgi:predicted PurR-regulated permease PerM
MWQIAATTLLPPPFTFAAAQDAELEPMLPMILNITQGITGAVGGLLLILALSTYWSADQNRFERLWLSLLPPKRRAYARDSWREIETAVGSYLRSQIAQSMLAALFLGIGAAALGMTPFLWAFLGALAAFVPLFGGLMTAIVAFGLGSLESVGLGLGAAVYTLTVFLGLDLFIEPHLWPRQRRGFLLTILIIIPLQEAFGLWGLIIAPPLAAALEVLLGQTYQATVTRQTTAVQLDSLETRYQEIMQKTAQADYADVTPELQNLATRLAALLSNSRTLENR